MAKRKLDENFYSKKLVIHYECEERFEILLYGILGILDNQNMLVGKKENYLIQKLLFEACFVHKRNTPIRSSQNLFFFKVYPDKQILEFKSSKKVIITVKRLLPIIGFTYKEEDC